MLIPALQIIGLSEDEIKIYLELLESGQATAGELAKRLGIVRPTVYNYLQKMTDKGVVERSLKHGIRSFSAQSPDKLDRLFEAKQKEIEQQRNNFKIQIPQLMGKFGKKNTPPKIKIFEGMSYAILPLIIATIISVFFVYRIEKKIPTIPILGAVVVTLFGGMTIVFDNKIFFYMKPTIINIIFAVILLYGQIFLKQPLLKKLFDGSIKISDAGWNILNKRWIYFFIFLAILNELVWRTQSEEFWVQFKVFGLLPITLIFTIMQVSLIQKYRID